MNPTLLKTVEPMPNVLSSSKLTTKELVNQMLINKFTANATSKKSCNEVLCQVCQDSALTRHFGAICCNACAAFFRRTIANSRSYVCPKTNTCKIRYDIPKRLCRACRFAKCLKVGMRIEDVQSYQKNVLNSFYSTMYVTESLPLSTNNENSNQNKEAITITQIPIINTVSTIVSSSTQNINNCTMEYLINWIVQNDQLLILYLNNINIQLSNITTVLHEHLLYIWCICKLTQSTINTSSQLKNMFSIDNSTFLLINEDSIRTFLLFSKYNIQDELILNYIMKSINEILDLSKITASCRFTEIDWALITHCAILNLLIQSTPSEISTQCVNHLNQLKLELELNSTQIKTEAINALIEVLLNLTVNTYNVIETLKLYAKNNWKK